MQKKSSSSVKVFYPEFNQADLLRILKERIKRLNKELPLVKVILFGSYSKGNYTVGSDIDLLVIYKGEPNPNAYAITKKCLSIPRLEPHLYSEAECEKAREMIQKMSEGGILLFS